MSTQKPVAAAGELGPAAEAAHRLEPHVARMERTIASVLGTDAEIADVLQDAVAAALTSLHRLKDPQALESWLCRVAATTALKTLRARSRRRWLLRSVDGAEELYSEPASASTDLGARRALRALCATLSLLPLDESVPFTLRRIERMELDAVAAACGVSVATIKRRLSRAERRFRANAKRHPELLHWLAQWPT
jgi:RNA polymerase sigma-70 factor (ECF subfamily)